MVLVQILRRYLGKHMVSFWCKGFPNQVFFKSVKQQQSKTLQMIINGLRNKK